MSIETRKIEYKDGETLLEAYMAWDSSKSEPQPGILIGHAWAGRDEFACAQAEAMAKLGYVGFALDMYGKDTLGTSVEENSKLMNPFVEDRSKLQQRMEKALSVFKEQAEVNNDKIGAIGFCFGGMCVLDLARTGADLKGTVSFHGLLGKPENITEAKIKSKVLVLHGYQDTMAKPEDLHAIQKELEESNIDWQTHCYGRAYHAFTNPEANNQELGTIYNEKAAHRAFVTMTHFFNETFE